MKILFISDVVTWKSAKEVLDEITPNVVFLGGDLTSDGFASFWDISPYELKEYRERLIEFLIEHEKQIMITKFRFIFDDIIDKIQKGKTKNIDYWTTIGSRASDIEVFCDIIFHRVDDFYKDSSMSNFLLWNKFNRKLSNEFRHHEFFLKNRDENHVKPFYNFLRYAGHNTEGVYVVKGDHDNDFGGDYNKNIINRIKGCYEISGELVNIGTLNLLGLGYEQTHYLRNLRPLLSQFRNKVDIVLTHAEEKRMSLISEINSMIIFRGHFRKGIYEINGIPVVSTVFPSYVIVTLQENKVIDIQYIEAKIL